MSNKNNRPRIQLPVRSAIVGSQTPAPVENEEVDSHEEGAAETDASETLTSQDETLEEVGSDSAELVTEAPVRLARSASVLGRKPRGSSGSEEVEVLPLRSVNRMRIGQPYYNFNQGIPCLVPRSALPLLTERGIIARAIH